jgi:hypothetical protein
MWGLEGADRKLSEANLMAKTWSFSRVAWFFRGFSWGFRKGFSRIFCAWSGFPGIFPETQDPDFWLKSPPKIEFFEIFQRQKSGGSFEMSFQKVADIFARQQRPPQNCGGRPKTQQQRPPL